MKPLYKQTNCVIIRESTMSEQSISITQLLHTFQLFDKNKDGNISSSELRSVCEKLHVPINEPKMKELFENRHNISFDEFCRIMQDYGQYAHDAYFQETFRAFDRNSDGYITAKEIKKTMKELGETLTDKQAKDMIKTADVNGDGKLSQEEFRILFHHITQQTTTPPLTPNYEKKRTFESPFKTQTE
ncbi:unnamed protein product [Rotaria sordida]|uniref:EF-hand domain-containing protein n=2 Tax=Rotaria sordida TaxID=392033 RepID=A0A814BQK1_9BILA|nr:unnamed protein product [Rotaria sordida]CAF0847609.1 unnamed protein product [Rotaria sordida]CAF0892421.1 unnamed protein product [Rotaria sordida]CAF0931447.1 unnamed protein product [Rotaria sordida]CAF0943212.1 unnamed protein product [Rotaria sordida]